MTCNKILRSGIAVFLLLFCSCSINQTGLPVMHSVKHFENGSNLRTEIEAWGIHVSTRPIDGGVVIGYTKRNYIWKKPDADASGVFVDSDMLDGNRWLPIPELSETANGASVLTDKSIGVSIRANRYGFCAGVGWRSTYLMEIDQDFEGVFFINIKENDFEEGK